MLLFRRHPIGYGVTLIPFRAVWLAVVGTVMALAGLVFTVHFVEWLGVLLLVYACLSWASPERLRLSAPAALFVLLWVHPLPGQIAWPIQGFTQRLSVEGSRMLLTVFDIPAWVDSLVIHGVQGSYEVPRACSGMRTATTVLACVLGAAVLLRFSFWTTTFFLFLGILQTLFLNIVRISIMVAKTVPGEASAEHLHDTTGVILLLAILLIQGEMALYSFDWRRRVFVPHGARGALRIGMITAGVLTLLGLAFGMLAMTGKGNARHKADLYMRVAMAGAHAGTSVAESAARDAVALAPDNVEYKLNMAEMLLNVGKGDEALDVVRGIPGGGIEVQAMMLQALVASGRIEEARGIMESLDPKTANHRMIALVRAELALREGDIHETVTQLLRLEQDRTVAARVRRFFPALASHEQWRTIYRLVTPDPYKDPARLLVSVTACLMADDIDMVEAIMLNSPGVWKGDSRFAEHILTLARLRQDGAWKEEYESMVLDDLGRLHPDEIPVLVENLRLLEKNEGARKAFGVLRERDPDHPGIPLLAARHVHLRSSETSGTRENLIAESLARFEERMKLDALTGRGLLLYADALHMSGRSDRALSILKSFAAEDPSLVNSAIFRQSRIHRDNRNWPAVYEILRSARQSGTVSSRATDLAFAEALAREGFFMYAAEIARKNLALMPDWREMAMLLGAILAEEGRTEEALAVVRAYDKKPSLMKARLLRETGRFVEENQVLAVLGEQAVKPSSNPSWALPPAERVVAPPVSARQSEVGTRDSNPDSQGVSPFLDEVDRLASRARTAAGPSGIPAVSEWLDAGRDPLERSAAAYKAALFYLQYNEYDTARSAVELGLRELPDSVLLNRLAVRLGNGEADVIQRAAKVCPEDNAIWIARVILARIESDEQGLTDLIGDASKNTHIPPGALVRASEYLFRNQLPIQAERLVNLSIRRDPGYLPAYLIGIHCARGREDYKTAMEMANKAAELAPDPRPFRKNVVRLAMSGAEGETAVLRSWLESLRREFPEEDEWAIRLGCLYVDDQEPRRAWHTFAPVIEDIKRIATLPPSIVTRIAQAAADSGKKKYATDLLELAHVAAPHNVNILNNLVYLLNSDERTRGRALQLIPDLIALDDSVATLDTIAQTMNKSGDHEKAIHYVTMALSKSSESPLETWIETHITAAEVHTAAGDRAASDQILETLLSKAPHARMNPRVRKLGRSR